MVTMSRTKRLILVVVVAASVLVTTGILVFLRAPDRSGWIQVGTISQVRARGLEYLPGLKVFVVAPTQGQPYALSAVSPHLGENLFFCQTSGWFVSLAHGEQFDLRGRYELGPAPAGMDRVALQMTGDVIDVNTTRITPGLPRGAPGTDPSPSGPFCVDESGGKPSHNIQVAPGVIQPSP